MWLQFVMNVELRCLGEGGVNQANQIAKDALFARPHMRAQSQRNVTGIVRYSLLFKCCDTRLTLLRHSLTQMRSILTL